MNAQKPNTKLILISTFLLGISFNPLHAAPIYYTFEGYIDNFGTDPSGEASSIGLSQFQQVSYTLEVDFSATGSRTFSGGTFEEFTDTSGSFYGSNYITDYFYSSLISSSHLSLSPKIYSTYNESINYNLGTSIEWSNNTASGQLQVDSLLTIQSQHRTVQDWLIGDSLQGFYAYGDETNGTDSLIGLDLTLTSINTTVVPLPPSIVLMFSGLIGLLATMRHAKTKSA